MKIYLAHDFLNQWGGGERVLEIFHEIFPQAIIKTITYDRQKLPEVGNLKIEASFIQKLPFGKKKYKWFLPLMPKAIEKMRFDDADLVLCDSSGLIKGINVGKEALYICYLHTTTRYLTVDKDYFSYTVPKFLHPIAPLILNRLAKWDLLSAHKPDIYIANSHTTAQRLKKYYQRDAKYILFPPVDTRIFKPSAQDQKKDYYLVVSRLVPYKKVDLAIRACQDLGKKLIVVGDGPERKKLEKNSNSNTKFLGKISDQELRKIYSEAKALIFPQIEDAGMTPIEAMACGTGVIAFGQGGATESIQDKKTGIFFYSQSVESLKEAILKYEKLNLNINEIIGHAQQFSVDNFKLKIKNIIHTELKSKQNLPSS